MAESTGTADGLDPDIPELDDTEVILQGGYCQVYERFRVDHVEGARVDGAKVAARLECRSSVVTTTDEVSSTSYICGIATNTNPGETQAVGTEVHLTRHFAHWHLEIDIWPLCGGTRMDCNTMRQVGPNYLAWVLEELATGCEPSVIEVAPEEKRLAAVTLNRMLEL